MSDKQKTQRKTPPKPSASDRTPTVRSDHTPVRYATHEQVKRATADAINKYDKALTNLENR